MFKRIKQWLESPVDKNDWFGVHIRELYQSFKLTFGKPKRPDFPEHDAKRTPEEQAAYDESNRLGVEKMTVGHPVQPKPYDDASFLAWLKIEMNTKMVFLAANKHLFTNADAYIERYSDIVAVIDDAINITELREDEAKKLMGELAGGIESIKVSDEMYAKKCQQTMDTLKQVHDERFKAEPVRTIETPVNTLKDVTLDDMLKVDEIDRRMKAMHLGPPTGTPEAVCGCIEHIQSIHPGVQISGQTLDEKLNIVNHKELEKPVPMICFQHGGSPLAELQNRRNGFTCPKCEELMHHSDGQGPADVFDKKEITGQDLSDGNDNSDILRTEEHANGGDVLCKECTPLPSTDTLTIPEEKDIIPKVLTEKEREEEAIKENLVTGRLINQDDEQHVVNNDSADVPAFEPADESYMEHVDPHGKFAAKQQAARDVINTVSAKEIKPTCIEDGEEFVEAPIYEQTDSNLDQFSLGANYSRVHLRQSIYGNLLIGFRQLHFLFCSTYLNCFGLPQNSFLNVNNWSEQW